MNVRFAIGSADRPAGIPPGRVVSRLLQERWRSVMYLGIDDTLLLLAGLQRYEATRSLEKAS